MAVPVIFISRLNESGDVIGGLRSGAIDYIRKPFESGEVLARICTVLRFHTVELEERRSTARQVLELLQLTFPPHVVQVMRSGHRLLLESFGKVAVVAVQLTGFRELCAAMPMPVVVEKWNT
ncbi:MAG: hypothetical protein AAF570_22040, partial [Bacteroidota bacterium]